MARRNQGKEDGTVYTYRENQRSSGPSKQAVILPSDCEGQGVERLALKRQRELGQDGQGISQL